MRRSDSIHRCVAVVSLFASAAAASACTNFIITKGASTDGSVFITYAADSHTLYGELYHTPARSHLPGEMRKVYDWDTGKYLGEIKEVAETFNVVGNINEHQVSIGETTWGGRHELQDPNGGVDYGSLMYIGLERARSARELIQIITDLVAEYGYYSEGETMSIADPNEAWIFEIVGKGPKEKGAVWVARRIPDGYISGHANSPRITTFPLNDPENTLYSPDVISFARKQGYFDGLDKDFNFAEAYGPADFESARFCDARVWCMFRRAAPSQDIPADRALGDAKAEPIPLWIKPDRKLSVRDVMELMRDHFEGTPLDMTKDVGAGPYQLPYRWRPLTWTLDGKEYLNERATSTQQTGFSFVAQMRSALPDAIGGVLWFGVDDTYTTVYAPMYCSITRVPKSFAVGTGNFGEFNWDSAFWTFNFVSNYSYMRYSAMVKDVQEVQRNLEGAFIANQPRIEAAAKVEFQKSPELAAEYLTTYSCTQGEAAVQRWRKLGEHLVWKYLDGNVKDEHGKITQPGYPEEWYRMVAKATGDRLAMPAKAPEESHELSSNADPEKAKQLASSILMLLDARKVNVEGATRSKIEACQETSKLEAWLIRAAHVTSADAIFADH
ncbi:MAG: C69 family dipeptidase [Phycisphaerales bacterium]|nr:C69 family dipeptidase [Phycisphaerales bacterium]MCB9856207.1 C69 family dipeptidase [Phycisphaerales bacterium]MCB9863354.1 C69 family dipeptidase [Phycisphaerales bacterium]